MASYNNPSTFLDGLGLRPDERDEPTQFERDELHELIHESIRRADAEDGDFSAIVDAILAASYRKQKNWTYPINRSG